MSDNYSVLSCASVHPNAIQPCRGLFNYRSLNSLVKYRQVSLNVLAPVPAAPPLGPFAKYNEIPEVDQWPYYDSHHPRFLYPLPKRLFKHTIAARSFSRSVSKYASSLDKPDIVHTGHIFFDGYAMIDYCTRHNLPLTVTARGTLINTYPSLPGSAQKKIRKTLEYSSGVFCVSDALARKAQDLTDPKKVHVIPEGADPSRFPVGNAVAIRNELDIHSRNCVILFVGSFTAGKGLAEIVSILPTIEPDNCTFIFVGHTGGMKGELRQAMSESSIDTRMYWQLSPLALRRLFAIANILLLPSHSEGRPTVIYEAMASETAVLATSIEGIEEQVVDGQTGILVPPGDVSTLKRQLLNLVDERGTLLEFGKMGRERLIKRGWTWKQHAERVEEHHRDIFE